jgi:hypothetical protein
LKAAASFVTVFGFSGAGIVLAALREFVMACALFGNDLGGNR